MTIRPSELRDAVNAVLAAIQRTGRLPTRLDEEDYDDLRQEGLVAAMVASSNFDPDRGSLRAFLTRPITRAILRAAWAIANGGITGDFDAVQVWNVSALDGDEPGHAEENLFPQVPDIAEEIEAFDTIWHRHYIKTS